MPDFAPKTQTMRQLNQFGACFARLMVKRESMARGPQVESSVSNLSEYTIVVKVSGFKCNESRLQELISHAVNVPSYIQLNSCLLNGSNNMKTSSLFDAVQNKLTALEID